MKGPRGTLTQTMHPDMRILDRATAGPRGAARRRRLPPEPARAHALAGRQHGGRGHDGFEKQLQIVGVGYRAALKGKDLEVQAGYSHPVLVPVPEGIEFEVPTPTQIVVRGNDKQAVGEIAAKIRKIRKPEPYKGKGIRYEGEYVRKKAGKAAKGAGA